jgi:hypothetical protein
VRKVGDERLQPEARTALAFGILASLSIASPARGQDLIVDASIGVPKVETNEFNVEGAATFGLAKPTFGFWIHGEVSTFDVMQLEREQTEVKSAAGGEAWYRLGSEHELGASFGVAAGLAQYSNDTTFFTPFASTEEASQMLRGSGGLGAWWKPDEGSWGRLDCFGGYQRETYVRTAVTGSGALEDEQISSGSFRYDFRLAARWLFLERVAALDVLGELEGYSLTRSRALFTYDPGLGFDQQAEVVEAARLEATARLGLAFVMAEFIGILPFAYGQLRHVRTTADGSVVATNVPSAGVGIRSDYF